MSLHAGSDHQRMGCKIVRRFLEFTRFELQLQQFLLQRDLSFESEWQFGWVTSAIVLIWQSDSGVATQSSAYPLSATSSLSMDPD